jgi:hypothetical protein
MSDLPKVNPVTIHSSFVMDVPFEEQVAKRRSSQSLEDLRKEEVARAELFKGQEMFATGDRSALGNFRGGGLEALLLDKYPDLADNPAFKTARFLAPQTLGEAAFEAATLFPPLFWMKPLKAGSRSYKEAQRFQDRIDKLQNTLKREKINAARGDGRPALLAETRVQNEIVELRDNILEIVRKENPAYAERLEDEARKRYAKARRDADPIEKVRQRMLAKQKQPENKLKKINEIEKNNLKLAKESGYDADEAKDIVNYYKGEKLVDDGYGNLQPERDFPDVSLSSSSDRITQRMLKDHGFSEVDTVPSPYSNTTPGNVFIDKGNNKYTVYEYTPGITKGSRGKYTQKTFNAPTLKTLRDFLGYAKGGSVDKSLYNDQKYI